MTWKYWGQYDGSSCNLTGCCAANPFGNPSFDLAAVKAVRDVPDMNNNIQYQLVITISSSYFHLPACMLDLLIRWLGAVVLVGLYEEPERPPNAVDYIKRYMVFNTSHLPPSTHSIYIHLHALTHY